MSSEKSSAVKKRVLNWGGLYAICDADAAEKRGLDLLECGRAMLAAGVPFLQVRAKGRSAGAVLDLAQSLLAASEGGRTVLVVNDRADVADLAGTDGVHVGQGDVPVSLIQRSFPELLVGCSTHDLGQLRTALEGPPPDYVAIGPVFPTASKKNPEPVVGVLELAGAYDLAKEAEVPLVAIGGVSRENLFEVCRNCDLVAAIDLLLPEAVTAQPYSTIENTCRDLNAQILDTQAGASGGGSFLPTR